MSNEDVLHLKDESELPCLYTGIVQYPDFKCRYINGISTETTINMEHKTVEDYRNVFETQSKEEVLKTLAKGNYIATTVSDTPTFKVPKNYSGNVVTYTDDYKSVHSLMYYKNGVLHRDGDEPAVVYETGDKQFYENGKLIKSFFKGSGFPGFTVVSGTSSSFCGKTEPSFCEQNTICEKPTIELGDKKGMPEQMENYVNPSLITLTTTEWFNLSHEQKKVFTGIVNWDDGKTYYKDGNIHRLDGPAQIYNSNFPDQYWINGKRYTKENWYKEIEKINNEKQTSEDMKTISHEDYHKLSIQEISQFTGAIKYSNCIMYLKNSKLHRLDGPAVIWNDGKEEYYIDGFSCTKEKWERETTNQMQQEKFMKIITSKEYFNLPLELQKNFTGIVQYPHDKTVYFKNGLYHREDGPAKICTTHCEYWLNGVRCSKEDWQKEIENMNNNNTIHGTVKVSDSPNNIGGSIIVPDPSQANKSEFQILAEEIGNLVTEKNKAYGNSFEEAEKFLTILFPNGIPVTSYSDMLCIVRMFDKLKRIATKKDAFGESPYADMAGYAILGLNKDRKNGSK